MTKSKKIYYILLFFSACFWGASFVFTKHLLLNFSPISIIFIRSIVASFFLLAFCFLFLRKHLFIEKKDIKIILGFSFFEPFLYFLFETHSLEHTSASIVSIIIATIPLFTALLSKYYFKEAFSKFNMMGVVLSFVGIAIMLFPGFVNASTSILGVILAFCAVFSTVGYSYFLKKLPNTYHPVVIVTFQNTIGAIFFFPLFLVMGFRNEFPHLEQIFEIRNLIYLLVLSIFCSSLAFIFYTKGLQNLGLARSNIFSNLIPVATAIIAFVLLKEEFPLYKVIGMVVVITGIFIVQRKPHVYT